MSKRPRRTDYTRKLAQPITLANGRVLVTLQDAADFISDEFGAVNLKWGTLDHCIRLLTEAGERGGKDRIRVATEQLDRMLRDRRLL